MFVGKSQADLTGGLFFQISKLRVGVSFDFQNLDGIFDIDLSGLCRAQKMLVPVKKLQSKLLFQVDELLVQPGLGNKQSFCCV